MTVNATLFVQFFNFLAAYFLIKQILLKPAVAMIQKDDKVLSALKNGLEKAEDDVNKQIGRAHV